MLKFEGEFVNGVPVGTFKYYFEDGKIKAVSQMYEQGRRSRTKVFHNNGRIMAEGNYLDRKKDSTWQYYSDYDGVLLSREHYENGVIDGIVINYYPTGAVAEELPYKAGLKHGEWKRYFTDGKLKLKATYIDDRLEGLMLVYHQKGFPEVSGMYKNNFKDGLWLYYNEEGIVIKKERYAKGNLKEVITPDPY
jgi:antitoxin component YwqK of YwqJK toxin-antitoxin module